MMTKKEVMKIVRRICNTESTNCRNLNKSDDARILMDNLHVPAHAIITEIPLDWDDQVIVVFELPFDDTYYCLFAGIGTDGKFYNQVQIEGNLHSDEGHLLLYPEPIAVPLDYFKSKKANSNKRKDGNTMTKKNEGIYNINEMRKVLVAARENGNKGTINKALCEEHGVAEVWFNMYVESIKKLYLATCEYITIKHSVAATEDEKKASREKLYPLWKNILSNGEKGKHTHELRCSETDIDSIVGYCEIFINDRNNIDNEEDFVSYKEIAHQKESRFRKNIEILLGIRIAGIEVMSDTKRNFLLEQRKYMNKRKKAQFKKEEVERHLKDLKRIKSPTDLDLSDIKAAEETISSCTKKIEGFTKTLKELTYESYLKALEAGKTTDEEKATKEEKEGKAA